MKTNTNLSYTFLVIFAFVSACSMTTRQATEKPVALIEDLLTNQIKNTVVVIENEKRKDYGFFVGEDRIVTNIHTIAHPGNITVKSLGKEKNWILEGVVAFDTKNKLAIFKVAGDGTPLTLGKSETNQVDQSVYIPNYHDEKAKVAEGSILSIRDRNKWFRVKSNNSNRINGSPVFNKDGDVIGVIVPYGRAVSSYAIPSGVINELLKTSNSVEPIAEWQKRELIKAEAHYSLGVDNLDYDRYNEAIVDFDKAIELNPDYIRAYFERGITYVNLGDFDSAMDSFSQAIKIDPQDAKLHAVIGAVKYHLGKPHDAIFDLNTALKIDPTHVVARSNLAMMKYTIAEQEIKFGNTDKAISFYHEAIADLGIAIQIAPDYATAYNNRGVVKLAIDDNDGALIDFNTAIQFDPEYADSYSNRAGILMDQAETESDQGNSGTAQRLYQKAVADCDTAIQIDPENASAYSNRAAAMDSLGRFEFQRGHAQEAKKLYQAAIADCNKAIQIKPTHSKAISNRSSLTILVGNVEYKVGNKMEAKRLYHKAIEDCKTAIEIDPWFGTAFKNRATAICKLADIEVEDGNSENVEHLYQQGITDYDKYIQLSNMKGTHLQTEIPEHESVIDSTVMILIWSRFLGEFSNGSGFFVDKDKIVTNIHVVETPGAVFAKHRNEETIWEILGVKGYDVDNDIVVLELEAEGIPLPIGESDTVKIGDSIISIGYTDNKHNVEKGTIHSIRNHDKWIRMNKESGDGSSGGPVLNDNKEVIGVSVSGGNVGDEPYSAAIPSNVIKTLLNSRVTTVPLREWQNKDKIQAYKYFALGDSKLKMEQYQEAIDYFDIATKLNPEYLNAYYSRGKAKFKLGMYQEEIADYDLAIQLNPEIVYIRWDRAVARYNYRDYEGAIDDFDSVIQLYPKFADVYSIRAEAKEALGRKEEAKADFEKAKELDPNIGE